MKHLPHGMLMTLLALLTVGLLLGFSGSATAATPRPAGTSPQSAGPLMTPTPSPTPGDPEWAILQYVQDHNSFWMCFPISGMPGHRTLSCYSMAGHWADGSVDNYGDPAAA